MARIVIIGAGFGGLKTAVSLVRSGILKKGHELVLIDKTPVHSYTPWFYTIASRAPVTTRDREHDSNIRSAAELHLSKLKSLQGVRLINEPVVSHDPSEKSIKFKNGNTINYDICVISLGSVVNDFGIEGVSQFALPLKTVNEALTVKDRFVSFLDSANHSASKLNLAIVGAGATGVELAGEFAAIIKRHERADKITVGKIKVTLIDGNKTILNQFPASVQVGATKRLENLGVKLVLNRRVASVSQEEIVTTTGNIPYDLLLWCAGVKVSPSTFLFNLPQDDRGRIVVAPDFSVPGYPAIFALGDCAAQVNQLTGRPDPQSAQVAVKQSQVVASNVIAYLNGTRPKTFRSPKDWQVMIACGGHYAIGKIFGLPIVGRLAYTLRHLIDLRYFFFVLTPFEAIRIGYLAHKYYEDLE